jgi:signal transduction histidine kinase
LPVETRKLHLDMVPHLKNHGPADPLDVDLVDEGDQDRFHRELDTILRFSALVNSSLNILDVLNNAMKWAEEFMDAEASSVYELDEEKNTLFIRLARGEKKVPVERLTLKVGEGIAGMVVQTGKPVVIQDVSRDKRFCDKFDRLTGFKTRSMICVPLLIKETPMGALQVLNKKSGGPFNRTDLELLLGMAQQIAVAMENAKLYQRLERRFELTAGELKKTQEKMIRSERLTAMAHLVQGVAHEIRNPIMTIGGFARRMKPEVEGHEKLRRYVDIILDETARLDRLVEDVHVFASVQSASLRLEDIHGVLDSLKEKFAPLAGSQRIHLNMDVPGSLPRINMDTAQMITALSHLMENAFEAMPNGGDLNLRIEVEEGVHLAIAVEDSGCGIPQGQLDSVYDPFVTSKPRGAGMGLTMVHQIVMNHRGEIKIRSEINKGTVVTILLPIPDI